MKTNVVLIGMPGCGKSTIGVVLAKHLGYRFIDSDLVIQGRTKKRLSAIIEESGLDEFLKIENEVNASIRARKSVIATGGSVVYGKEAMEHLRKKGVIVYLRLPLTEIDHRLGDLTARGVAIKEGQTLSDLYSERTPLYEQYADITIDCLGKEIRHIVAEISSISAPENHANH